MTEQKIYPADTVDSTGKVWETVGENIRHGEQEHSLNLNDITYYVLDKLYPVGYVHWGALPPILSTLFKWSRLPSRGGGIAALCSYEYEDGTSGNYGNALVLNYEERNNISAWYKEQFGTALGGVKDGIIINAYRRVE